MKKQLISFDSPPENKIILDLCGGTGAWSKPYKDAGYDVESVTLPMLDIRCYIPPDRAYGILAAPPCPMFSFARTKAKRPRNLRAGMELVIACLEIIWKCQYRIDKDTQKKAPLKFWALENPNGMLKWFLGKPIYEFDPYDFGDNYRKRTHLWGYFNKPKKNPIKCSAPKFDRMPSKDIHAKMFGKLDRTTRRAITPAGFARAFFEANQ